MLKLRLVTVLSCFHTDYKGRSFFRVQKRDLWYIICRSYVYYKADTIHLYI